MARIKTRGERIRAVGVFLALLGVLLALLITAVGLVFDVRVSFSRPLGQEIDVLAQCKSSYGPDTGVIGRDDSPTGWHCVTPDNRVVTFTPEDMQAACDRQHPGSRAAQVQAGRQFWRCV